MKEDFATHEVHAACIGSEGDIDRRVGVELRDSAVWKVEFLKCAHGGLGRVTRRAEVRNGQQ